MAKTPLAPANMSILSTRRRFFEATRSPAAAAVRVPSLFPALIITDSTPPSQPGTPAGTAASTSQIDWTWTASTDTGGSGLSGYRVYVDGAATPTTTVTTNAYSSTGHSASTTHTLRVEAFDGAGNSVSSGTGSQTTQSETPTSGQQVSNLVVLDNFSDWRLANNNFDKYFDIYNASPPAPGNVPDAGPNQVCNGVANSALNVTVPTSNVWYVDADCAPYTNVAHWLHNHIKSGTWASTANRMAFLVRTTINGTRDSGGSANCNLGTYTKPLTNLTTGAEGDPPNGQHYYHSINTALTANRWCKFVIPNCPDHQRTDAGQVDHNAIAQYWHEMTRCYWTYWGIWPGNPSSVFELAAIQLFQVNNEPDNEIRSLTIHYDGSKYQVTWCGRKNVSRTYEIRYRTDGTSLKSAGFTSGTAGGTGSFGGTGGQAFNPGNDYTGCFWDSPAMAESVNGIYVGIRVQSASQFHELYLPFNVSPSNTGFVGV